MHWVFLWCGCEWKLVTDSYHFICLFVCVYIMSLYTGHWSVKVDYMLFWVTAYGSITSWGQHKGVVRHWAQFTDHTGSVTVIFMPHCVQFFDQLRSAKRDTVHSSLTSYGQRHVTPYTVHWPVKVINTVHSSLNSYGQRHVSLYTVHWPIKVSDTVNSSLTSYAQRHVTVYTVHWPAKVSVTWHYTQFIDQLRSVTLYTVYWPAKVSVTCHCTQFSD